MVDPVFITNYNLDDAGLEEYILFCIAVAGKNAKATSKRLDFLLQSLHRELGVKEWRPFHVVSQYTPQKLATRLREVGIGCYNLKGSGIHAMATSGIDLRRCKPEDLEKCPGVGHKTSRFFILHTRRAAKVACLDTHILRWMNELGYDVPRSSPQNKSMYCRIEKQFLELARQKRMSPAKLDLYIWRKYSGNVVENHQAA